MLISVIIVFIFVNKTGVFHVAFATVFLISAFVHALLNKKWYANLFKGKYSLKRYVSCFAIILSDAAVIITVISGICALNGYNQKTLHIALGAWVYLLTAVHMGMHSASGESTKSVKNSVTKLSILIILIVAGIYFGYRLSFFQSLFGCTYTEVICGTAERIIGYILIYCMISAVMFLIFKLPQKIKQRK